MKLNSLNLEAFAAAARLLNFTKAAESLHITQSALSQRIAKLENDLETTLFVRDRASVRLTESGEKVLRFCQVNESAEVDLLSQLQDGQGGLAGTIRIGGFSSVSRSILLPALKMTLSKNPRLSVQLFTRELRDLEGLLKTAEADYILSTRKSDIATVESILLGYEINVLAKPKKHSLGEIYIDHDESDVTTRSFFAVNKISFKPQTMRYLDDVYGLIDGIKLGLGLAVVPKHLIEDEKEIEIVATRRPMSVPIYLCFYRQPYYKRGHQEIVTAITSHFGKVLSAEPK